jgi:hypothetical protein
LNLVLKGSLHVKLASLPVIAMAAAVLAATTPTPAQGPQNQAPMGGQQQGMPPGGGGPMGNMPPPPPPTNLKVLPKNMTGKEVRDVMEKWAGSLGVHCDQCHVEDPKNIGPNGRPRLKFADDSKPDKQIARLMYTMTEQINNDTIKKAMDIDKSDDGSPVTCGTCHRGHKMPEVYVIPPRQNGPGMGPGMRPGGGAPPAGAPPPGN